jgi:hypothetical protein
LVLDNGYSAKTSGHTTYIRSPGNLVRILGGSRLDFSSENYASGRLNIGSSGGWEETRDNRIEVADGGILKTDSLFIGGFDNTLVVSNGTLVAGNSETSALWLGYSYNGTSSNVTLVVAGTNTVIRCEDPATEDGVGILSMQYKSVLRYEIPKAGYARDHVPVVAKAATIESNCKLEVDCEEWAANGGITGNKLVLFRSPSSKGISNLEKLVAACVDTLPPGVTLSIVNGDLVLRRPGRGYRVLLR